MRKRNTSWGHVASWYDALLKEEGTYHKEVILPNLLRLMDPKPHEVVLDLACGQGFFTKEFARYCAKVIGVDISPELIAIARQSSRELSEPLKTHAQGEIEYVVSPAEDLGFLPPAGIDKAALILALDNIENVKAVFTEVRRVLRSSGALYIVLNHPAFRIPRLSSWGWDEKGRIMYRRLDGYMSERIFKIQVHPGSRPDVHTITFHRPIQWYFKHLTNCGFCITRLEEWISGRKSQPGPRARAENSARKEFPLFLFLEARPPASPD